MNRANLSPYVHTIETVNTIRFDLLAALLPLVIIATVQNGLRVLVMCFLAAAAAWTTETLGNLIKGQRKVAPFRVATLGVCMTLLCPVTVPVWMPAAGAAFAVLFVRVILIGNFRKLFMSPAIGWLFMLSVWPEKMMSYPLHSGFSAFPIFADVENFEVGWSIAQYLQFGEKPPHRMMDILMGQYPGGMGTTCIVAIMAITVYFLFRRSIAWQVSLSMMCTVGVFALFINRADVSPLYSVIYELAASSYVYVAIFIAGDLINAPKLPSSRVLFGILLGVVTMMFRYFGLYEHCVVFALVFVNLITGALDRFAVFIRVHRMHRLT